MTFIKSFSKYKNRNWMVVFILLVVSTLYTIHFATRRSYDYPYKLKSDVKLTSGLIPNTTNIFLYSEKSVGHFPCVETQTTPSFLVCIYSRLVDQYVSPELEDTGVWEPCITRIFQQVIQLLYSSCMLVCKK